MTPRVSVIGSGYVGTVVAVCLAWLGREVVAVESDSRRLHTLRRGDVPFHEPELDRLLGEALAAGTLRFTDDMSDALEHSEVVFLCVGTPLGADGHADMTAVRAAAAAIGENLISPHVLVTKSTVPIGTGRWLESLVEDAYGGGDPIETLLSVVSCPEFLREGSAVADFLHPDRVVLGGDDPPALEEVVAVYEPVLSQEFPGGRGDRRPALVRTGLVTAETVKYAANAFLATKISFINEMASICELVGADVAEVSTAIGLDSRIGPAFLGAGAGWGGSCFGKDLSELINTASDHGHEPRLLRAAVDVNTAQRCVVVDKLRRHLKTLQGRRIALLGLAFKPGTDDLRDAPAVDVARRLIDAGARVTAHDPCVESVPGLAALHHADDVMAAVDRADAVVLMTEWPEYTSTDWGSVRAALRGDLVVDGRNALDPDTVSGAGLRYEAIGRAGRGAPAPAGHHAAGPPPPAPTETPALREFRRGPSGVDGAELRFLLYSHDGVGLGHFMRNLKVATELAGRNSRATVVLASSTRVSVPLPAGVDRVGLPALRKAAPGVYLPRTLRTVDSALALRADLLAATVESFRPHAILVDRHPLGLGGELDLALNIGAAHGSRLVLGLRDILDDPDAVAREWPADMYERIAALYDSIIVYGDPDWFDPITTYSWPAPVAGKVQFVGLPGGTGDVAPERRWRERQEPSAPDRPFVVAAVGGGGDGAAVLRQFLVAVGCRDWRGVAFTGPDMPAADREEIMALGARAKIRVSEFDPVLAPFLRRADLAVTMAGANTVCDILEAGCRSVLVPRARPRREQLIRAGILARLGRASVVPPDSLTPDNLLEAMDLALALPRPDPVRLEGAARAADVLFHVVAENRRRPVGEQVPV